MYAEDKTLLSEIQATKNLRPTTLQTYQSALNQYTSYCQMSMTQLLAEADQEEEQGIRWKHRQIRKRLIGYRAHLLQKYEYQSTSRIYLSRILTIYRYYEIELQPLPSISTNNKKKPSITYDDLPTKDIIRKAVNNADPQLRAIILFMSSSGTARNETTKLTIKDFIKATNEYHNQNNIHDVLKELDPNLDIVPTWHIHRQKTNKDYVTFSSPESSRAILDYLSGTERTLTDDSRLFGIGHKYLTTKFSILNDRLGFGKVGHSRRLRGHMLRKYHASQLSQGDGLSLSEIDALQGRTKKGVHKSYFFDNPSDLKRKYCRCMSCLFILEEKKDTTEEFAELQRRYDELQANIKMEARKEVRKILLELGYEL